MKWLFPTIIFFIVSLSAQAQNKVLPRSEKKNEMLIEDEPPAPSFPGGEEAYYKFIAKNLKRPGQNKVNGRVIMSFFVEKDGSLTNIKVERSMGKDFDNEALRVIKKSPKWIPAMKNGRPIRVKYALPISFYN